MHPHKGSGRPQFAQALPVPAQLGHCFKSRFMAYFSEGVAVGAVGITLLTTAVAELATTGTQDGASRSH